MYKNTPNYITVLPPQCIFVFGSNLAGRHGKGVALLAHRRFGAEYGVGEGLTGQCYAFPTLDGNLCQRSYADLYNSMIKFYSCVRHHPSKVFLLTKVGTGLGGYTEEFMRQLFADSTLPNLVKPEGW